MPGSRRSQTPMLATILLLGLMLVAAVTDLLPHKIYNWTTYSGILAALGLERGGRVWLRADGTAERGWHDSARKACCGLAALRAAGDDGLLLVLPGHRRRRREVDGHARGASGTGTRDSRPCCGPSCWAACVGLIVLVWRVGPVRLVARVLRQVAVVVAAGPVERRSSEDERAQLASRRCSWRPARWRRW